MSRRRRRTSRALSPSWTLRPSRTLHNPPLHPRAVTTRRGPSARIESRARTVAITPPPRARFRNITRASRRARGDSREARFSAGSETGARAPSRLVRTRRGARSPRHRSCRRRPGERLARPPRGAPSARVPRCRPKTPPTRVDPSSPRLTSRAKTRRRRVYNTSPPTPNDRRRIPRRAPPLFSPLFFHSRGSRRRRRRRRGRRSDGSTRRSGWRVGSIPARVSVITRSRRRRG